MQWVIEQTRFGNRTSDASRKQMRTILTNQGAFIYNEYTGDTEEVNPKYHKLLNDAMEYIYYPMIDALNAVKDKAPIYAKDIIWRRIYVAIVHARDNREDIVIHISNGLEKAMMEAVEYINQGAFGKIPLHEWNNEWERIWYKHTDLSGFSA